MKEFSEMRNEMQNTLQGISERNNLSQITVESEGKVIATFEPLQAQSIYMRNEKYETPAIGEVLSISEEICKHLEIAKLYKAQIEAWRKSAKAVAKNIEVLQKIWEGGSREAQLCSETTYKDEFGNALPTFQCLAEVMLMLDRQPEFEM